jgi:hypothetical protein
MNSTQALLIGILPQMTAALTSTDGVSKKAGVTKALLSRASEAAAAELPSSTSCEAFYAQIQGFLAGIRGDRCFKPGCREISPSDPWRRFRIDIREIQVSKSGPMGESQNERSRRFLDEMAQVFPPKRFVVLPKIAKAWGRWAVEHNIAFDESIARLAVQDLKTDLALVETGFGSSSVATVFRKESFFFCDVETYLG